MCSVPHNCASILQSPVCYPREYCLLYTPLGDSMSYFIVTFFWSEYDLECILAVGMCVLNVALTLQEAMKRRAAGIWCCKGCRKVVAGGAYVYW